MTSSTETKEKRKKRPKRRKRREGVVFREGKKKGGKCEVGSRKGRRRGRGGAERISQVLYKDSKMGFFFPPAPEEVVGWNVEL